MAAKTISCNLTKYVKVGANRWQYCPVVRGKTGRVKQDLVVVSGCPEHHPEGYYALDWREDGRRRRVAVGNDAGNAQQAQDRQNTVLTAHAMGIAVAASDQPNAMSVREACEEFLAETRLQRVPKTYKQYRTALTYFEEVASELCVNQVDRRTLLSYRQLLGETKGLSARTVHTKMEIVAQMLKANGVTGLLRRGDWPRYVERVPQAYSPEQLRRFFAACGETDVLLFQFFLGSGFREKEVQFLTWRDLSLEEQVARVTAKPECGFFPKTWEERAVLIPSDLVRNLRVLKARTDPDCPWVFPPVYGRRRVPFPGALQTYRVEGQAQLLPVPG